MERYKPLGYSCDICYKFHEAFPGTCCGEVSFMVIFPSVCYECGGIESKELEMYFGPEGSICENCVPRFECSCNTFKTKKAAIKFHGEIVERCLKKNKGCWIVMDDKGRLRPCVDYF